jgi:SAM-dependent methyltransferase
MDRMHDILDYGGADGRLMQAFLQPGRSCALVDYTPQAIPGVVKLADTLESLPAGRNFDLIVCSHVIEHVAEPLQVVQSLSRRLRPEGALYVEVPMEIWRKPPWQREPVTHINFFTPNSLWNLLHLAGLEPRSVHLSCHLHPGGLWKHCIRALATRTDAQTAPASSALKPVDLDRYLHPGPGDVLRYHAANPRDLWRTTSKRMRKRLRGR